MVFNISNLVKTYLFNIYKPTKIVMIYKHQDIIFLTFKVSIQHFKNFNNC